MKSKKNLALFVLLIIVFFIALKTPHITVAQNASTDNEQIASDLSLDLNLAAQNPAPEQKQITQSQQSQAQITTSTGEQVVVKVEDTVPPEVKTQPAKDAVNPEQTTSEQVITKTVEETVGPNGSQTPGETQPSSSANSSDNLNNDVNSKNPNETPSTDKSFIPGTTIIEPDDNKAVSPTNTPANDTISPNPGPEAPGSSAPAENSSDSSTNNQSSGDYQSLPADTPADSTTVVQGVSTSNISLWQKILNKVSLIFNK